DVPFLFLREVADIAGVDEESGLRRHRLDLVDRLGQCGARVGVGRQVKADMAVADLHESKLALWRLGGGSIADQAKGARHAAAQGPNDTGARPGHALQQTAAVHVRRAQLLVLVPIGHLSLPNAMMCGADQDRYARRIIPEQFSPAANAIALARQEEAF